MNQLKEAETWTGITNTPLCDWMKDIWQLPILLKLRAFLWKVVRRALPFGYNLATKGLAAKTKCHFCDMREIKDHLFLTCQFAASVWAIAQSMMPPSSQEPQNSLQHSKHQKHSRNYHLLAYWIHIGIPILMDCLDDLANKEPKNFWDTWFLMQEILSLKPNQTPRNRKRYRWKPNPWQQTTLEHNKFTSDT